jgi:hypothetical protein
MPYGKAILIALDQLLNALVGGWPDETISSRAYRWDVSGVRSWPRRCIDRMAALLGDTDHCRESFASERLGRQLPPEARP